MRIGSYSLLETVGRGGMGTVVRARRPDGSVVAIKLLHAKGDTVRFDRERRLLESLGEAEGFVPLLDAGTVEEGPFIVMPFLPGGTLRARLERGSVGVAETVGLAKKLAAALARAHERGIVHRDLKPENVIFTGAGEPLIADLGLAKHFDRGMDGGTLSVSISRDGQILGTAGYMPLEQVRAASEVGPPADVFAIGAILYECLAGAPAFPGDHMVEVLAKLEAGTRRALRKVRPDAPPWLVAIVGECLAKDAAARFPDAGSVLRALVAGEAAVRRGRRAVLLAVLAALALAGAGGVLALPGGARATPPAVTVPPHYEQLASSRTLVLKGAWGVPDGKHAGPAECVTFSPDGRFVVSGGCDRCVRFWDVTTGKEARTLPGHLADTRAVALSRDGKRLVSVGGENVMKVWDLANDREVRSIGPLRYYIHSLELTPDGKRAIVAGCDANVNVWDLDSGVAVDAIETTQQRVNAAALSPDGTKLLTAGEDATLRLLDLATGKELGRLDGHSGPVTCVAFSPDGTRGFSGGNGQAARSWDLATLKTRWAGQQGATISTVAVSPDGRRGASAGDHRTVLVWDIESGKTLFVLDSGARAVRALAFSPDSRRLAAAAIDNAVHLWELPAADTGTVREVWTPAGHRGQTTGVALSDDGTRVASCGLDGVVRVRDAATGEELRAFGEKGSALGAVAFLSDGKHVVAGGYDAAIRVYETASGRDVKTALGHSNRIVFLAALDARRFVSGGADGTIRVWDLESGSSGSAKALLSFVACTQWLESAALDSARRTVFTAGRDGVVKQWDLETGALLGSLETASDGLHSVAADGEGRVVACGSDDVVKFVDWKRRVVLRALAPLPFRTFGLALLGGQVASARAAGPLLIHDIATGEKVDELSFEPARDEPSALAASRDGRVLVVGTQRGLVLRYERR